MNFDDGLVWFGFEHINHFGRLTPSDIYIYCQNCDYIYIYSHNLYIYIYIYIYYVEGKLPDDPLR